ncbi:MAG: hypothetical protein JRS35_16735 [Deltaproteobacteria bacterium]|nr:hypothetical protein [Deltaproteobacteria bacterium]
MRNELAVDLDLHRVEPESLALGKGDEEGNLGVGRIEQLFLEMTELRSNAQDVRFDLLDLLVQALHLLLGDGSCDARSAAKPAQQGEEHGPDERAAE